MKTNFFVGIIFFTMQSMVKVFMWFLSDAERTECLRVIFARVSTIADMVRPRAAESGNARMVAQMDEKLAQMSAAVPAGSTWTFHKDQWGPHEVVVMPRVIDSNTGVVTGPPDNPERGSVVTCDGQMPNCEPGSLNQILYGSANPNTALAHPLPSDIPPECAEVRDYKSTMNERLRQRVLATRDGRLIHFEDGWKPWKPGKEWRHVATWDIEAYRKGAEPTPAPGAVQ